MSPGDNLKKDPQFETVPLAEVEAKARPIEDAKIRENLLFFPSQLAQRARPAQKAPPAVAESGAMDGK